MADGRRRVGVITYADMNSLLAQNHRFILL